MSIALIRAPYADRWHIPHLDVSTSTTRTGNRFETVCGRYVLAGETRNVGTVAELAGHDVCGQCRVRREVRHQADHQSPREAEAKLRKKWGHVTGIRIGPPLSMENGETR